MTSFTLVLKLAPKLRNSTKNSHGFYLRGQKNKTNFHENNLLQIYQKPAKSAKKYIYKKLKNLKNHCLKYFIVSDEVNTRKGDFNQGRLKLRG